MSGNVGTGSGVGILHGGGLYLDAASAGATLDRQATLIAGNTPNNCAGAVSC